MSFTARFEPPSINEFEIDQTDCETCGFSCDVFEYCKKDAIDNPDLQDQYLHDLLKDKGYGGCTLKLENIRGKNWLVLYVFNAPYLFAEKCNVELGVPVVPLKTGYTMNIPGLNVSNCYTQFLDLIDKISPRDEPVDTGNIINVDDMFEYCKKHYPSTVDHCIDINITSPEGIINVVDAFENLGLTIIADTGNGKIQGYIPREELVL